MINEIMKFSANGVQYTIYEVDKIKGNEDCLGLTSFHNLTITLKIINKDAMVSALKHELAHVWLYEYAHGYRKSFGLEDVCEIVSRSNDFINSIVNEYINIK